MDKVSVKERLKSVVSYDELIAFCQSLDVASLASADARKILRALRKYSADDASAAGLAPLKVAFLGNITFEPLPDYVQLAGACQGLSVSSYVGAYDQVMQELMHVQSGLRQFVPDMLFLHYSLRVLAEDVVWDFASLEAGQLEAARQHILQTVSQAVQFALSNTEANVLLSNFSAPPYWQYGVADQKQAASEAAFYYALNQALLTQFQDEPRVQLLDIEQALSDFGKRNALDERMYYLAKAPWKEDFYPVLADRMIRHAEAFLGQVKKCLVLDLDNTLWGGVLGEEGVHGVHVGHGDAVGEAFYDFQKRILALKHRGVVLAICSKNNIDDVRELFTQRTDMPLQWDDFSAHEISWDMKHEGIRRIAEKLNIGLDSLVFIDDNPAECELIEQMLPQVQTVLLPPDPSGYVRLLDSLHGFERVKVSQDDVDKARQYAENAKRAEYQGSFSDLQDYLYSLETVVTIHPAGESNKLRVHQLFSKTNQFNLTTKRYSQSDVERFIASDTHDLYVVHSRDRFGDLGIIGLCLIYREDVANPLIDSFILSCRAMGRGIESAVMNFIKNRYLERGGADSLQACFIPTQKNKPASSFYPDQGFQLQHQDENGTACYHFLSDNDFRHECSWITLNTQENNNE